MEAPCSPAAAVWRQWQVWSAKLSRDALSSADYRWIHSAGGKKSCSFHVSTVHLLGQPDEKRSTSAGTPPTNFQRSVSQAARGSKVQSQHRARSWAATLERFTGARPQTLQRGHRAPADLSQAVSHTQRKGHLRPDHWMILVGSARPRPDSDAPQVGRCNKWCNNPRNLLRISPRPTECRAANGLATSRAHSMKTLVIGLCVRFCSVMTPTAQGGLETLLASGG